MAKKRILPDGSKTVYIVILAIFSVYAVSLVYPLVWVFVNSFRTKQNFFMYPLRSIFEEFSSLSLKNYANAFKSYNIGTMFFNSILISVGATVATMIVSAMAAYVVNKYDFALKNVIYIVSIFIMIIPTTGSIATTYKLMNDLGLWNDYYSPYMYMREEPTLAVGIYLMSFNITNGENAYDYPGLFALMMMATIPIIVVFSIFQKTIMANTVAGGIKG